MLFQIMSALLFMVFTKLVFSFDLSEYVGRSDNVAIPNYLSDPRKPDEFFDFVKGEHKHLNNDLYDIEIKHDEIEKSSAKTSDDFFKQRMDFIEQKFVVVNRRLKYLDRMFSRMHHILEKHPEIIIFGTFYGEKEEFEELKFSTKRLKKHIDAYNRKKKIRESKALEKCRRCIIC